LEILFGIIICIVVWLFVIYNLLVKDRNRVLTAWSDIDVQLKRRYDLVPKLVEAVKQYASYEAATIKAVTEMRSTGEKLSAVTDRSSLEIRLGGKLHKLIALAEAYPELKANQSFLELQHNLTDIEKHIQHSRRYYNGCVRNLNVRIESFPDMFVARRFNFVQAEFFELEEVSQPGLE
jgi:LemA protein